MKTKRRKQRTKDVKQSQKTVRGWRTGKRLSRSVPVKLQWEQRGIKMTVSAFYPLKRQRLWNIDMVQIAKIERMGEENGSRIFLLLTYCYYYNHKKLESILESWSIKEWKIIIFNSTKVSMKKILLNTIRYCLKR